MEKILIIGAGGHARSCIDVIQSEEKYEISGLIVNKNTNQKNCSKYKIIGTDDDLLNIRKKIRNAHIGIAHMGSIKIRERIISNLIAMNFNFPAIKSKESYVSSLSKITSGSAIMHGCIINAFSSIGSFSIINTGSIIEHDVIIGKNCHIAPGTIINGGVKIGNNVFIGSGSIIHQEIEIPKNSIIPSSSLVNKRFFDEKE